MNFFESYYRAAKNLNDKDRLAFYDQLLTFYFDGEELDVKGNAAAVWEGVKPVVMRSLSKSGAGKKGGRPKANEKQTESKRKANEKQTESHMDMDMEKEKEKDINTYVQNDLQKIVDRWNRLSDVGIAQVRDFTDKRKTQLQARVKNHTADHIMLAIDRIRGSDFLCGRKTDWKATFDWFIKPGNITKILEGNYDNKGVELNGNGATKGWGAARDRELGYA